MFWGITLENGKRYTQIVDKAFHISMASLEQSSRKADSVVSVMIEQDKSEFLLCTLQHGKLFQQPLDLNFMIEDTVTLYLNGEGIVHLTGYTMDQEEDEEDYSDDDLPSEDFMMKALGKKLKGGQELEGDDSDSSDMSFEPEDDDEEDSDNDSSPQLQKGQKRKAETALSKAIGSIKRSKSDDSDSDEEDDDDDSIDDEDDSSNFLKQIKSSVGPQKGNKTPGGPQVIKTPQQSGKKNKQQQQQQQKSPGGSPGKGKQEIQKNGKGNQQQKSPSKTNTPAPKTPALANGDTTLETSSAKKRRKNKKKGQNTSDLGSPQTPANQQSNKGATTPVQTKSEKKNKKNKQTPGATPGAAATPKQDGGSGKGLQKLPGGTQSADIAVGNGPVAKPGKFVQVYYKGKVGNKEFDSCLKGKPFKFRLGAGEVIKGWDAGIQGMKVGGKRTLVVPPNQAYGEKTVGPIAANSTLHFEVQLLAVS